MNRSHLQVLSKIRRREAAVLLKAKLYDGAYYLMGYAVECALKACIAKQTRKHDFPNKDLANKVFVHNLGQLLGLAGLQTDLEAARKANSALDLNWAVVKDWKESERYVTGTTSNEARDMYIACTSRKNGILPWIRARW
jgi:HEPN domain-containing protein